MNTIQETGEEGTNDNEPLITLLNDVLDSKEGGVPKEEKKEKPKTGNGEEGNKKWLDIKFDDTQKRVISEATSQGKGIYGITVKVQEACILKAARAFLVFKALEEMGEVIISKPSVQDIEDERFDLDFSLIYISESPLETILKSVRSVSEIEDAQGALLEDVPVNGAVAAVESQSAVPEVVAEEKDNAPAADKPASQPAAVKPNEKKAPVSKPVVKE